MAQLRVGPLVRATNATSVVIWAELPQSCLVRLSLLSLTQTGTTQSQEISTNAHTVTIGGRHYIAPQVQGLQSATWYCYRLTIVSPETDEDSLANDAYNSGHSSENGEDSEQLNYSFRTMDAEVDAQFSSEKHAPLRVAYGSCRKFVAPSIDALSAFGRWLRLSVEQRAASWPHFLLLLGDQIYADRLSGEILERHPDLQDGAHTFEEFAQVYEYTWTQDNDVRQALACLPTFMIFDDHEILNSWNITPYWHDKLLKDGLENVLVDGLVAYWVYQGWGNLTQRDEARYPLLRMMREGEQSGEDMLDALRTYIRGAVHEDYEIRWHYEIQTMPPLFVLNVRSERSETFPQQSDGVLGPLSIASRTQMRELTTWLQEHDMHPALLVSSVPVLLPPFIGVVEYFVGLRLWWRPLRWLGKQLARKQLGLAEKISFDHWPTFIYTWNQFVQLFRKRAHDLIVLSGDVHFSYAMKGINSFSKAKTRLYQFVCSPVQNSLSEQQKQLITRQAPLTHMNYGGLDTRMLPLRTKDGKKRVQYDMLFQNAIAYVTLTPTESGRYDVQHDYYGVVEGELRKIGSTDMGEH